MSRAGTACRRQHPIAMLRYTYRYLFLLLVPLARGLRYIRTPEGLYNWVRGAWIDLLTLLALLLISFLEWQFHTYAFDEDGFIIRRGVFVQRESVIPRRHVVTLTVERPFYLRPLGAVQIAIDTDAGSSRHADFRLTVSEKWARELLLHRRPTGRKPHHRFQPKWYHVALLSLFMSNSFSGIFLLATALRQTGRQLSETFREQLLGDLETMADYVTLYVTIIPRTAAIIALVLLCGWAIAAMRNLLRLLPFRVTRQGSVLSIRTGLFIRRDYICTAHSINYVDYRQSLLSKFLRLHMVFINCIGYGKDTNTMAVLVPVSPVNASQKEVHRLLPEYHRHRITLKAAPLSIYRYIFYPLWAMILLYPASGYLQDFFPQWSELIYYLTFIAYIPCAWQLLLKTIDRFTAGLTRREGFFTLRYSRLYTFHTVLVPEDKIVAYDLKQTFFQVLAHNCDVLVYTYGEAHQYHRIKNIPLAAAEAMFADLPRADQTERTVSPCS